MERHTSNKIVQEVDSEENKINSKLLQNKLIINKKQSYHDVRSYFRSIYRSWALLRARLRNEIYPMSFRTLTGSYIIGLIIIFGKPDFFSTYTQQIWTRGESIGILKDLPIWIQGSIYSGVFSIIFFYFAVRVRQWILRRLLSYRPWLHGEKGMKVILWGTLLKLFSGSNPTLLSCQKILPRLSVPPLSSTIDKLIESSSALLDANELDEFTREAQDFQNSIGWKLQLFLKLRSWFTPNYVSDWWEKYAYRKSRGSIVTGSNYYGIAQGYWTPTNNQASRASVITHLALKVKTMISREEYPPMILRKMIPLCSAAYKRLMGSVRIPCKDMDITKNYQFSKHVIVNCCGVLYKLTVFDSKGQILNPIDLEGLYEWIIQDAKEQSMYLSDAEKSIPALTCLTRDDWAQIREEYLVNSKVNRVSLEDIESCIFFVVLSDIYPIEMSEKGQFCNHVDGKSIWYDKSVSILFDKDGKTTGVNIEHTVADGSPMCHSWEWIVITENSGAYYTEDGKCKPLPKSFGAPAPGKILHPEKLNWEINSQFSSEILRAVQFSAKQIEDLDLEVYDHPQWGKGEMKKCGVSPDAFMQAALQLAHYRDMGFLAHTYEPTMMRFYLEGRTECVRSCTPELTDFVRAMTNDQEKIPKSEKIALLKKAATKHQQLFKAAMDGQGIDRHLFALYIAAKGLNYEAPFLEKVLSKPWVLSTTQSPTQQLEIMPDLDHPYFLDKLSPGGGFMTVCDDGYGVAYIFAAQVKLFFHVSSRNSCPKTSSKRFVGEIVRALDDIRELFQLDL